MSTRSISGTVGRTLLFGLLSLVVFVPLSTVALGGGSAVHSVHFAYIVKGLTANPSSLTIAAMTDNRTDYPGSGIPKYEKLELTFDVQGATAQNPQLPYDPAPPAGIEPGTNPLHRGITVDGLFTPDNWQTVYRQPGFYYEYYDDQMASGWDGTQHDWSYPSGRFAWKVRFAPSQEGTWQYKVVAEDASGRAESPTRSVSVVGSSNSGFVGVSKRDPRYFEFSDGSPFLGLGYGDSANLDDPVLKTEPRYQTYAQNHISLLRMWISSLYGSAWLEWLGGRNIYDGYLPRSGLEPFRDPQTNLVSLAQVIEYQPTGNAGWYDACRYQFWNDPEAIKPNTNYKFKIKYWGMGISGPRVTGYSNYGLVGKISTSQLGNCYEPGTGTVITGYGGNTTDWGYIEGVWNSGNYRFLPRIHLGLENVIQGKAYIDSISVREDMGNGQYGPEIIVQPSMQYDLYFSQPSSHGFDKVVELAAKYGMYLKLVVEEKNDSIYLKLNDDGTFVLNGQPDNLDGFYGLGRGMNKTRWLQQAWWRYLQARWGYSTHIHSWELTNEGDPSLTAHYELADEFGKYMHCGVFGIAIPANDAQKCTYSHPNSHLVTTSFWHSFPANQFWNNAKYPNVDYADVHAYISTSRIGIPQSELEKMQWDSAYYHTGHSIALEGWKIDKPIVRGEAGIDSTTQQIEQPDLARDTTGVWLHKFIWAMVDPGALYEMYWWRNNIANQPGPDGVPGLYEIFRAFYTFMQGVPLNNGRYTDAAASVSNPNLRALGQKDPLSGKALLWVDNTDHTWKNVVDGSPITPQSGTVSLPGMPPGSYVLSWYDTYLGVSTRSETVSVGADGVVSMSITNLATDVALNVERQ